MQNNPQTEFIEISQLLLDPENPRLASVQANNHDAIRAMTKVQGEKVLALAKHLIENGPNPANLMMVIPTKNDTDFFYVLDGNRRLTALKLLESPLMAEGILTKSNLQLLKKLSTRFEETPMTRVNCVIFENRKKADLWIQLVHRGLNKGAGMLPWDGQVGARYDERRKGHKDVALQLLDFTKDFGLLSENTKEKIDEGKFPITTLNRILSTPYARKKLGIEKSKEDITFLYPKEEVVKGLSKVVEDLASGEVTVSDLKKQDQRIDYIKSLESEELPQASSKLSIPIPIKEFRPLVPPSEISDSQNKILEDSNQALTSDTERPSYKQTPFPKRKSLIPRNFKVNISQRRINGLFRELKSLDINEYSNSGAVMLRVFIELSVDYFVEEKLSWNRHKIDNSKLSQRLGAVANFMKENGIMTIDELAPIQKAINGDGMLAASVKSMNQYVHNRYYSPVASELIVVWDDFQNLVRNIWLSFE